MVIGRVPLFYYVAHFGLIHVVASGLAYLRYGRASIAWLFMPLPSMGGPAALFPAGFGYSLWATYVVWIAIVLMMYPLCRWFAGVKMQRTAWISSRLTRPPRGAARGVTSKGIATTPGIAAVPAHVTGLGGGS